MQLVPIKDSRGDIIGVQTLDDEGNVVDEARREAPAVPQRQPGTSSGSLPQIRGDFRSIAQRRVDAAAAESSSSDEELQYTIPRSVLDGADPAVREPREDPEVTRGSQEPGFFARGAQKVQARRQEVIDRGGIRGAFARANQFRDNITSGVIDAVDDVFDFAASAIDMVRGIESNPDDNLINLSGSFVQPTGSFGQMTKELTSFATATAVTGGLLKKTAVIGKLATGGWKSRLAFETISGGITDFYKSNDVEENLFNAVEGTPLQSPISDFLKADTDEEANLFMHRVRETIGGGVLGIGMDIFGEGVSAAMRALQTEPLEKLMWGIREAKKLPEAEANELLGKIEIEIQESADAAQTQLTNIVTKEADKHISEVRELLKKSQGAPRPYSVDDTVNPAIPPLNLEDSDRIAGLIRSPEEASQRLTELEDEFVKVSYFRNELEKLGITGDGTGSGVDVTGLDKALLDIQREIDDYSKIFSGESEALSKPTDISDTRQSLSGLPMPSDSTEVADEYGGIKYTSRIEGENLVDVDVERVYNDFQKNGLTNLQESKTKGVQAYLDSGKPINAPELTFSRSEGFDIIDGRHRITELHNRGIKRAKAVVSDSDAKQDNGQSFDPSDYTAPPIRQESGITPTAVTKEPPVPTREARTKPEIKRDVAIKETQARIDEINKDKPKPPVTLETSTSPVEPSVVSKKPIRPKKPTKRAVAAARAISLDVSELNRHLQTPSSSAEVGRFVNITKLVDDEDARQTIEATMAALDNVKITDSLTDNQLKRRIKELVQGLSYLGDPNDVKSILTYYANNTATTPVAQGAIRYVTADLAAAVSDRAKALGESTKNLDISSMMADAGFADAFAKFTNYLELNKNLGKTNAQALRARGISVDDIKAADVLSDDEYFNIYARASEATETADTIKSDLLNLLKTPEGRKNFDRVKADLASAKTTAEVVEAVNVSKFMRFGSNVEKLIQGVRMNSILSGTRTQSTNVLSGSVMSVYVPITRLAGATIDMGLHSLRGDGDAVRLDREVMVESLAILNGLLGYIGDAATMSRRAFSRGKEIIGDSQTLREADQIDLLNLNTDSAFINNLAKAISLPSRLLITGDELFKQLNYRAYVRSQGIIDGMSQGLEGKALKEYAQKMVNDSFSVDKSGKFPMQGYGRDKAGSDYAKFITFQSDISKKTSNNRNAVVEFVEKARDIPVIGKVVPLFVPFIKTPSNVMAYTARNTPLAFVSKAWQMDYAAGGAKRAQALGEFALGSTALMGIVGLAMDGRLTGRAPSDAAERDLWYANGNQPYSIKVGNKWVSFERMEPFASHFAIVADIVQSVPRTSPEEQQNLAELMGKTTGAFVAAVRNRSYFQGLQDLTELIGSIGADDSRTNNTVSGVAGQIALTLAPYSSFLNEQRRARDLTVREAQSLVDDFMNRVPGLSKELPAKYNYLTGEPVQYGSNPVLNLFPTSNIVSDPVISKLLKYNVPISPPSRSIRGVELTSEEYSDLNKFMGNVQINNKTLYQAIGEEFDKHDTTFLDKELAYIQANEDYATKTSIHRSLTSIRSKYMDAARTQLLREYPELVERIRVTTQEGNDVKQGIFWMNSPLYPDKGYEEVEEQLSASDKDTEKTLQGLLDGPEIIPVD